MLTTIAGTGATTFSGDNGAATYSTLRVPMGVAVDSSGNVYVADQYNHRVRKITASTGIISTLVGNGNSFSTGDGGASTSGTVNNPTGVAVDSSGTSTTSMSLCYSYVLFYSIPGNVYIVEYYGFRVRKVTSSTGIISSIAGTGDGSFSGDGGAATSATFSYPRGIGLDSSGNTASKALLPSFLTFSLQPTCTSPTG